MKNYFILSLLFMVFLSTCAYAQKGAATKTKPNSNTETFTGTLLAKQWSKSIQSYCAQGSDYTVLKLSDDSEVVLENMTRKKLSDFDGKNVEIRGYYETKRIKQNNEGQSPQKPSLEQRPDTGGEDFTCKVLVVQTIRVL